MLVKSWIKTWISQSCPFEHEAGVIEVLTVDM